ncbi:MAG: L,D-transpeptidase [Elusimicrobiota bacterium]
MRILRFFTGMLLLIFFVSAFVDNNNVPDTYLLSVKISNQTLYIYKNSSLLKSYPISSSMYGSGSNAGSNRTPLGLHYICKKIGANAPLGSIFINRENTGQIAEIFTDNTDLKDDFVTTRILRLAGLEQNKNLGENIDSKNRSIYIHGTNEEGLIGKPASHGCIRMKNQDIIELFETVPEYTIVEIRE